MLAEQLINKLLAESTLKGWWLNISGKVLDAYGKWGEHLEFISTYPEKVGLTQDDLDLSGDMKPATVQKHYKRWIQLTYYPQELAVKTGLPLNRKKISAIQDFIGRSKISPTNIVVTDPEESSVDYYTISEFLRLR